MFDNLHSACQYTPLSRDCARLHVQIRLFFLFIRYSIDISSAMSMKCLNMPRSKSSGVLIGRSQIFAKEEVVTTLDAVGPISCSFLEACLPY